MAKARTKTHLDVLIEQAAATEKRIEIDYGLLSSIQFEISKETSPTSPAGRNARLMTVLAAVRANKMNRARALIRRFTAEKGCGRAMARELCDMLMM